VTRNEKQLLLFFGLAGFGAYLWFTQSGRQLATGTAQQIETGVKRLADITDSTLQTIMGFESFSGTPYPDARGWSIGYGHFMGSQPTIHNISMADAYDLLRDDVQQFSNRVKSVIKQPMSQSQFDAMVSLAYNIGESAFAGSTVARLFNQGNIQGAADAFRLWRKSQGAVLPALVSRREQERSIFMS